MHRKFFALAVAALAFCGMTTAKDDEHAKGDERVKVISAKDVAEKVDGKDARATTVVVTFKPGEAGTPHRHPGPVFGYVLEGEYEWAIDDQPAKTLKAGETFYEPGGCLHRVSKNASATNKARVLAVVLHPRDSKSIVLPAGAADKH